jgi:hypothetical protein
MKVKYSPMTSSLHLKIAHISTEKISKGIASIFTAIG